MVYGIIFMSERNCWETSLLMKFKMFTINKGAASAHLLESKSKENIAAIWAFSKCNGWGPRGRFSWVIRQFWQHREMACHARASILVIFYDFGISYDLPKVSFFWDWSQDMSSSGFPPKSLKVFRLKAAILGLWFVKSIMFKAGRLFQQKTQFLAIFGFFY